MRVQRLLLAAGVLAAGLCAAWPFRLQAPALLLATSGPQVADVAFRRPDVTLEVSLASEPSPAAGLEEDAGTGLDNAAVTFDQPLPRPDLESTGPAPQLSADFGPTEAPRNVVWKPARPASLPTPPRQHRITDGDSLEQLAIRYLGSRERAGEIYEMNRDVLASSDLLPLGRIIRIPPAESAHDLEPAQ